MSTDTTTAEHELLNEIAEAERAVARKEAVVNDLKEQMKIAKEEYEGAVYKLREICRQQANDEDRPLLKDDQDAFTEEIASEFDKRGILAKDGGIKEVTLSVNGRNPVVMTADKAVDTILSDATKKLKKK